MNIMECVTIIILLLLIIVVNKYCIFARMYAHIFLCMRVACVLVCMCLDTYITVYACWHMCVCVYICVCLVVSCV